MMAADTTSEFLTMLKDHLAEVLSAGGIIGGGMIGFFAGREKNKADAAKSEAEALIAPFEVLIRGYEAQARADAARIEDLSREVKELRDEVIKLRKAHDAQYRDR